MSHQPRARKKMKPPTHQYCTKQNLKYKTWFASCPRKHLWGMKNATKRNLVAYALATYRVPQAQNHLLLGYAQQKPCCSNS